MCTHWSDGSTGNAVDQQVMREMVTDATVRYTNKVTAEAVKMHVEHFHKDNG